MKINFTIFLIVLLFACFSTLRVDDQSNSNMEHKAFNISGALEWARGKLTGDGSAYSNSCTNQQQRLQTNMCHPKNNKCWSWCLDDTTFALNSDRSKGKWCYLATPNCKTQEDCIKAKPQTCAPDSKCADQC